MGQAALLAVGAAKGFTLGHSLTLALVTIGAGAILLIPLTAMALKLTPPVWPVLPLWAFCWPAQAAAAGQGPLSSPQSGLDLGGF